MFQLNQEIIPNHSIAGVCLGSNIEELLENLSRSNYTYVHDSINNYVKIGENFLSIYFNPETKIITDIFAGINFEGTLSLCSGRIWTGMTVLDVINNTQEQLAWCGFIKVNKVHGFGISLPDDFDDFDELDDFLSIDFIFDEIAVYIEDT